MKHAGGRVRRVVLDYELKRKLYPELNKEGDYSEATYAERKQRVAEENGIAVVNGKFVIPDLRIEYETANHDLEQGRSRTRE